MATSYITFLKITTSHNYYVGDIPPDLKFIPSEESARQLKNNRLKFNQVRGGIELAFQSVDGATPLIQLNDLKLYFLIKLENAMEFFNFTDLDTSGEFTARKKLFFQNNPQATKSINHTLIDWIRPKIFTYNAPLVTNDPETETLSVELEHVASGTKILIADVPASPDGGFEVPIDLSKHQTGLYKFSSTTSVSNDITEEKIIVDDKINKEQLFGLIELSYQNDSLAAYELLFERKTNLWNYILINKTNRNDFNSLFIKDNSEGEQSPYQPYLFAKTGPEFTVGEKPAVKFQSNVAIPYYELPKRDIELVKEVQENGQTLTIVYMKNLANPPVNQISSSKNESDIYVFV